MHEPVRLPRPGEFPQKPWGKHPEPSQISWLCRDLRGGEMAELPNRVSAAISILMEVKPRWGPGPGIRVA
jgi:hypothetical protein